MPSEHNAGLGDVAITFTNAIYEGGYWGVIYIFHNQGTVDYVSTDRVVLNGTISAIGDEVDVFYQDATYQFTVSAYDNAGAIVLSFGSNLYVMSNTTLTQGQILTLNTDGPGEYAPPPCFVEGTRILTRQGEVAVEALKPGDEVVAVLAGQLLPVVWVGRREVECAAEDRPAEMWPFRVRAHAFGPGRPARDLYLSPDHAVHVDGMLVPIRYLENGATILRERRERVTYFHVELARHDILLSEGLGSESYLDTGNRDDFVRLRRERDQSEEQAQEAAQQIWAERGCMALTTEGVGLRTLRTKIA
ncbi:MAG: Hint domain-containing protein, partial [Devosia sp.]|nr:Hint domain-containing protein [Devosia sp.]